MLTKFNGNNMIQTEDPCWDEKFNPKQMHFWHESPMILPDTRSNY